MESYQLTIKLKTNQLDHQLDYKANHKWKEKDVGQAANTKSITEQVGQHDAVHGPGRCVQHMWQVVVQFMTRERNNGETEQERTLATLHFLFTMRVMQFFIFIY